MKKTAPQSTVSLTSDVMYEKYKRFVYTDPRYVGKLL